MDKQGGVSNTVVKRINLKAVFSHLMERGPASVRDVSAALGMSAPTVVQNLNEMVDRNLVAVQGMQRSTGGRKARAYGCERERLLCGGTGCDQKRCKPDNPQSLRKDGCEL